MTGDEGADEGVSEGWCHVEVDAEEVSDARTVFEDGCLDAAARAETIGFDGEIQIVAGGETRRRWTACRGRFR